MALPRLIRINSVQGQAAFYYARKRLRLKQMMDKLRKPRLHGGAVLHVVLRIT